MKKTALPIYLFLLTLGTGVLLVPTVSADEYWEQRVSLFDTLPVYRSDIVFLGNSITDGGEFSELFGIPNIKNRGIRSDIINGVRKRLHQVTSGHPQKIFLLIGINDVAYGHGPQRIAERYRELVRDIRTQSPETELIIQSIMPINNSFRRYKGLFGREKEIVALNGLLSAIAKEEGATFVDLTPALSDAKGNLKKEYTNDGLHLTGKGYKAWGAAISSLVSAPVSIQTTESETEQQPDQEILTQQQEENLQESGAEGDESSEEILPLVGSKVEHIATHRR